MYNVLFQTLVPLAAVNGFFLFFLAVFIFISRGRPRSKLVEEKSSSIILNKWFRDYWIWLTDPVVQWLIRQRVSPNTISFVGFLFGVAAGGIYALGWHSTACWTLIFGATFDIFDGRVARETNRVSKSGAFFDSVLDRISESVVFTGIAYHYRESWIFWLVMTGMLGSLMTSYTKNRGNAMGVDYEGGLMQRPERIVYLGVGGVFLPLVTYGLQSLGLFSYWSLAEAINKLYVVPIGIVAVLSVYTTIVRIRENMKLLDRAEAKEPKNLSAS